MHAIKTEGLTKHYTVGFWRPRPYVALDGLSLEVAPAEIFGFLGPNGAGKTTTLKLLMQLVYPTSGAAWILGKPVGDLEVKRRIGYLPENPYFYDYLTANELLTYFASLFGYRGEERRRRVADVLDQVGIGAERRMQLRQFSKGMIQRVGIAQAILNQPEVVFLDEPMSGLDPLGRRDMRQLMMRLRDSGCTVFFSSHILADAESLCSRVAILAGGRLVTTGRLTDMVGFELRGWELIVSDVSREKLAALGTRVTRIVPLAHGRFSLELPPDPPEALIAELARHGGRILSLNPVRDTLEDLFVRQIAASKPREPVGA
ncbi:MAG TPA: ABC transporter ATP-binding protein [Vicinamibacterales bacterium]|jgi:ABC-2 type transport system ATP-binding protein|nr:ABC transporter ATP-binding protein [Vicinamibacterales bacterium]